MRAATKKQPNCDRDTLREARHSCPPMAMLPAKTANSTVNAPPGTNVGCGADGRDPWPQGCNPADSDHDNDHPGQAPIGSRDRLTEGQNKEQHRGKPQPEGDEGDIGNQRELAERCQADGFSHPLKVVDRRGGSG